MTAKDYLAARTAADKASAVLREFHEARRPRHEALVQQLRAAEEALRVFQEEGADLVREQRRASEHVLDLRQRLVGPWEISGLDERWKDGTLRLIGCGQDAWAASRAWLRVAKCCTPDWQWEVRIDSPIDSSRQHVVLGPPTSDPAADFERHRVRVEELLCEAGFVVVTEEELRVVDNDLVEASSR